MATDTASAAPGIMEAAEAFLASARGFDPRAISVPDSVGVAELAARVEKAAACVRLLAASRAVDAGANKEEGIADPAAWIARQAGTTGSDARQGLALARSLEAHPQTKEALLSGAVSLAQAQEVLRAEGEHPGQEEELLAMAERSDLTRLREERRERTLASTPPEDLHRRQLAARRFRHWRDDLGMVRLDGALPPETGIPFVNRIEREALRLHEEAKRKGDQESFSVHAADALVALAAGTGTGGSTKTDLVVVCDLYAWRRGHTHQGEVCHILGGGPIPVELAKELSADAFLKCVLHDGKNIHTVSHHGRHLPSVLKTALDLGAVPAFSGRACVDCQRRYGIEYDHTDPYANGGPTSYANLRARCWPCHADKTERDRLTGRLGERAKARGRPTGRTGAETGTRAGQRAGGGPPRRTGPPPGTGPNRSADPP